MATAWRLVSVVCSLSRCHAPVISVVRAAVVAARLLRPRRCLDPSLHVHPLWPVYVLAAAR